MVSLEPFRSLDRLEYEGNAGRIADVENLNRKINGITSHLSSGELVSLFNTITVPISEIKTISEVVADPLVERVLLFSEDPVTGTRITLAPPPNMPPFLNEQGRQLSFPPRSGEHNGEIYSRLGYAEEELSHLKEKGVI
jgi:crotonobetainyl-CoA:carnitine CoA-transferase CaiB-like acyl-CoA transferase